MTCGALQRQGPNNGTDSVPTYVSVTLLTAPDSAEVPCCTPQKSPHHVTTKRRKDSMKPTRLFVVALCLSLALACGDHSPTAAPAVSPPQADLIGSLLGATGLLKCSALPYAQDVETIGPAGALSAPTTITMTVPTGLGVNAVKFQPEGLRFAQPAVLTMSYSNCSLLGKLL